MTASQALRKVGVRSTHFYAASLGSIGLCISLWIRAKTVDQDERGNAERRALFVGLWPPMFWLMGDSLKDAELVREELLGRVDESAVLDELPRLEINYDPARAPEAGSNVVEGQRSMVGRPLPVPTVRPDGIVLAPLRDPVASAGAPGPWMPPPRELISRPGWA
jgi:hypothetical protein